MPSPLADIHGSMLNMDLADFRKLHDFLKRFPNLIRPVVAQMLNDLAFKGRTTVVDVLDRHLIIRDRRFDQSRVRVEKASPSASLSSMAATLGTIYTRSSHGVTHDGWRSLESGNPVRDRTIALAARGGRAEAKVRSTYRLKPGVRFPTPDDMPGSSSGQRLQALIARAAAQGTTAAFIVPKGHTLTPGLYRPLRAKKTLPSGRKVPKVQKLQTFDRAPRTTRWAWMRDVLTLLLKAPMGPVWSRACDKVAERFRRGG